MPTLPNFNQFAGRHWETGSVANVLAYQGVQVPQLKAPYSEALLLGISGGATFGYFVFDYKGHDPHVSLLSRNTFDPLPTLLSRIGVPQDLLRTADPKLGERNLIEVLEGGRPAIVWADGFSLPYNLLPSGQAIWGMQPIVVFGYESQRVSIADRSARPLQVSPEELARARARVKKERFRILALGSPDPQKLPEAIRQGIGQCIQLYTQPPPKGTRDNFGFAAYRKWAKMLTNTRNAQSWERLLAPGVRMYAALAGGEGLPGAFGWSRTFPSNQVDDKRLYAEFLEEAAVILKQPELKLAAERFRASSAAWEQLSEALLPDEVPIFGEARRLMLRSRDLFVTDGEGSLQERRRLRDRLRAIRAEIEKRFPLESDAAAALRERLAERVLAVAEVEQDAVGRLQQAMA